MKKETIEEAAKNYIKLANRKYPTGFSLHKDIDGEERYYNSNIKSYDAFIEGAKWQAERSQKIVPFDAYNIEVFAIKPDENGQLFAYIGYKISNGNFEFNVVPFTEP
jgi:hypothetical protein